MSDGGWSGRIDSSMDGWDLSVWNNALSAWKRGLERLGAERPERLERGLERLGAERPERRE